MTDTIIEVENLSKVYRMGSIGTGTLTHDLNRWWHRIRGKEDPYVRVGEKKDRKPPDPNGYIWSLKDINFQVDTGEVLGIVGKNGAGKSTLLKILSKITKPTTGVIRLDGRVASLLEVGTGFHPELTGRENIYLNGAVLGMKRAEIKSKFDEIVNFSGVAKYINTPVKRYSSGMYVRLAFAVAAHLEPEILIVDEVLAVGDHEFQQKCLGKMRDVSTRQGRTVLFVSHNIPAVKQLCNRAILLENGLQKANGPVKEILSLYQDEDAGVEKGKRSKIPYGLAGYFTDWKLDGTYLQDEHTCNTGDTCTFSFGFRAHERFKSCEIRFIIKYDDILIMHISSLGNNGMLFSIEPGQYRFTFRLEFPVRDEKFDVEATFVSMGKVMDIWLSPTRLTVLDNFESRLIPGMVKPDARFAIEEQLTETIK